VTPTQSSSLPTADEPGPRRSPTSVGQVFALVAAFLALAAIGAAIGWAVTDTSGGGAPVAQGSTSPPPPSSTPSPTPTPTPSAIVGTSAYQIPDFHALRMSFIDARSQIIAHKIGVAVKFTPTVGGTAIVARTNPPAGTLLRKGQSVTLYVNEAPPLLAVPSVISAECNAAGAQLAAVGFTPKYPQGRTGTVTQQSVPATSSTVPTTSHWNDTISITCLVAPTQSTSSPASAPSNPTQPSGPASPA
jgi:PASTA domain